MKGIWIRSQLKNTLYLCDGLAASATGNLLGYQGPDDVDGIVLGTYETEERAIEILNLLQNNCKRNFSTANMPKE